jgi:hypothetical protein
LDALVDDDDLLDEYRAIASGGSRGIRGVFVYDSPGWVDLLLTLNRWRVHAQLAEPLVGMFLRRAVVAAGKASHLSYAAARTLGIQAGATNIPATLPISTIVARLNELQPTMLSGYPTRGVGRPERDDGRSLAEGRVRKMSSL